MSEQSYESKVMNIPCDVDARDSGPFVNGLRQGHQAARHAAAEHAAQADARIAELEAALAKEQRRAIAYSDVIANQCIAMQAAVIEFYVGEGSVPAIAWIENTLCGPGLLPDHEAAQAMGGAQAWFDAKMAEHDAFRAAHPGPAAPARAALGPKA